MNLGKKVWNNVTIAKNGRIKKEYGFVDYEHYERVKQAKYIDLVKQNKEDEIGKISTSKALKYLELKDKWKKTIPCAKKRGK